MALPDTYRKPTFWPKPWKVRRPLAVTASFVTAGAANKSCRNGWRNVAGINTTGGGWIWFALRGINAETVKQAKKEWTLVIPRMCGIPQHCAAPAVEQTLCTNSHILEDRNTTRSASFSHHPGRACDRTYPQQKRPKIPAVMQRTGTDGRIEPASPKAMQADLMALTQLAGHLVTTCVGKANYSVAVIQTGPLTWIPLPAGGLFTSSKLHMTCCSCWLCAFCSASTLFFNWAANSVVKDDSCPRSSTVAALWERLSSSLACLYSLCRCSELVFKSWRPCSMADILASCS